MVGTVAELDQGRRRSVEVRVKLAPALADEFSLIAEGRGLLPATLAAVALGEYVEKHRQNVAMARMMAVDLSKRTAGVLADPETLGKAMASMMSQPGMIEAFAHQGGSEG